MAQIKDLIPQGPPGSPLYTGKYSKQQTEGNNFKGKRYQRFEKDPYNEYQNFLYNRALFGLTVYNKEEIQYMHKDKKERIKKVHKRTQDILNMWKQSRVNELCNHLFSTLFPKSPFAQQLLKFESSPEDLEHYNDMSFRTLKITKPMIIERLMTEGILPRDFHDLKPAAPLRYKSGKLRTKDLAL